MVVLSPWRSLSFSTLPTPALLQGSSSCSRCWGSPGRDLTWSSPSPLLLMFCSVYRARLVPSSWQHRSSTTQPRSSKALIWWKVTKGLEHHCPFSTCRDHGTAAAPLHGSSLTPQSFLLSAPLHFNPSRCLGFAFCPCVATKGLLGAKPEEENRKYQAAPCCASFPGSDLFTPCGTWDLHFSPCAEVL